MIEISIPGFYSKKEFNKMFLDYKDSHPEKFYDDVVITSCYDSFPCIWNGGRVVTGEFDPTELIQILKYYNSKKISLRYTFTNSCLEESDVYDRTGNNILDYTKYNQKVNTGINVNSKILSSYIREKHPEFYFLSSTTLGMNSLENINEASKTSIVVPDYSLNNNFDKIKDLENKDNIEWLVGEACIDNCPNRKEHYCHLSKKQLGDTLDNWVCPHNCEMYNFYDIMKRKHYIGIDDIREKYIPLGFTKFKISGRTDTDINLLEKYINYMVKPEYKDIVRNEILNKLESIKNIKKQLELI